MVVGASFIILFKTDEENLIFVILVNYRLLSVPRAAGFFLFKCRLSLF